MNVKKITAFLVISVLLACSEFDSYQSRLDSLTFTVIDTRLDSLSSGIGVVDSAIADGFTAIANTINGLKEKVATLEAEVKTLKKENERLKKIIDGYRNPDGKPYRLLPIKDGGGQDR